MWMVTSVVMENFFFIRESLIFFSLLIVAQGYNPSPENTPSEE